MVTAYIDDYFLINNKNDIVATTWELSDSIDFTNIISKSEKNSKNRFSYTFDLTKEQILDIVNNNKELYIRVKIHTYDNRNNLVDSDWFYLENREKNTTTILTIKGKPIGRINKENNSYQVLLP